MKISNKTTAMAKILIGFTAIFALAVVVSAASWIGGKDSRLGIISVTELADWMIQGRADYTTIYLAPKVTKIKKIDGLICITEDGAVSQELGKLPSYKKWVVITPDGTISEETSKLLVEANVKTVLVLNGGKQAWESQLLSSSLAGLALSAEEVTALNMVRPYFNQSSTEAVVATPVVKPVSVGSAPTAEADESEEEEEEGC